MKLDVQRRIAASVLKCSPKRVVFDSTKLKEIKEAITKADMRGLVIDGCVVKKRKMGISSFRSKKIKLQKSKGKRKGHGSRKGMKNARTPGKESWMGRVRLQRKLLKRLKEKKVVDNNTYWDLYRKIKGGFFRSKRHLQLYLGERKLSGEKAPKQEKAEKKKPAEKSKIKEMPAKNPRKEARDKK
jgi:large subunit ribosomal protein L19e